MTRFRHLIWMVVAAGGLLLSAAPSHAQSRQPDVGDQPGLMPDDSVELDPEYRKQMVYYRTNEAPGTIIISTAERHLYLVQGNGRAIRYGIGVGREGFQWQGLVNITRKAEWPDWTPPPEMIQRQPYLCGDYQSRQSFCGHSGLFCLHWSAAPALAGHCRAFWSQLPNPRKERHAFRF